MFVRVDWTLDRNIWQFQTDFTPDEYCAGVLAESYEIPDLQTIIVKIREGIYFQDKPPVNGRELTAYDVEEHYDRVLGIGHGYTEPLPMYFMFTGNYDKVTAIDKYTVEYKFKSASAFNLAAIMEPLCHNSIEAPEWVKQGDLSNWKNAVGTGPWIITDYMDSTSITYTRNPNYWGYDERFPENQVPYADTLKVTNIPDISTSLAALRTGKVDLVTQLNWKMGQNLKKTNPELEIAAVPSSGAGLQFRVDTAPFDDIRVRKALQLSIDRATIAKSLFGGTVEGIPIGMVNPALMEYCYQYKDWPQELKDEYSYNPGKAKELLTEAGYPNGFTTNVVTPNSDTLELVQAFKAYLLEIGVDMEIKVMEQAQFSEVTASGKHDQLSTQESGICWPPNRTIQTYDSRTPENPAFNNDPEYDALVDQFWQATESEDIVRITRELDKISIKQHWMLTTFATVEYNMWSPKLKGYSGETQYMWGGGYLFARLWKE